MSIHWKKPLQSVAYLEVAALADDSKALKREMEKASVRCSKGTFLSESIALTLVTARANSATIGDSNMFDYANDAVNTWFWSLLNPLLAKFNRQGEEITEEPRMKTKGKGNIFQSYADFVLA